MLVSSVILFSYKMSDKDRRWHHVTVKNGFTLMLTKFGARAFAVSGPNAVFHTSVQTLCELN